MEQQPLPSAFPIDYVLNPSPAPTAPTTEGDSPSSGSDTFPFLSKFVHKREHVQPNYWVRDLELLLVYAQDLAILVLTSLPGTTG